MCRLRGSHNCSISRREIAGKMRIIPAGAERADYGIEARQLCSKICIVHIGFDRLHIRRGENLIRVTYKSGDCMTTRGEFAHHGIADITRTTNDCV